MGRDRISNRFFRKQDKERLKDLSERARTTEDRDAERDLLADTKKVDPIKGERAPGRNDPCPCGSGKKYKKCCGAKK